VSAAPGRWFFLLLAAAVAGGLAIAWVDSRPSWDDAGVIAGVICALSSMFGCAQPRRPWIWALAIGGWIPLLALARSGSPASLLALGAGGVGAYAGAGIRRLLDGPR
jgi:hypothetical protein